MKYFLKGVIDRLEGNKAVIILESNQEIIWPKNKLPKGVKEGSSLKFFLKIDKKDWKRKVKIVSDLLKRLKK